MSNLPLRVPTDSKPTFLNKETGIGYLLGGLASLPLGIGVFIANGGASLFSNLLPALTDATPAMMSAAATALGPLILPALATAAACTLIGTAWGAIAGKHRMERELQEGVEVKPPSIWNKNMFAGIALADLALTAIGIAAAAAGFAIPVMADALITLGGLAVGAVVGGGYGKQEMQAHVVQAERAGRQIGAHGKTPEMAIDRAPALAPLITPDEQAQLNSRLREGQPHAGHAAKLGEARLSETAFNLAATSGSR